MTGTLLAMAERLTELGVTRVVMEATSDYWNPVFYVLEAAGFQTWLVNAKDVKHLPGRPKTDRLDAVWLCKVAERQMLRPSFGLSVRGLAGATDVSVRALLAARGRVKMGAVVVAVATAVGALAVLGTSGGDRQQYSTPPASRACALPLAPASCRLLACSRFQPLPLLLMPPPCLPCAVLVLPGGVVADSATASPGRVRTMGGRTGGEEREAKSERS